MNIGLAIKQIRKQKGFKTQKSFASACKIPANTICQIELDRVFPRKDTLATICNKLNISSSYLFLYAANDNDVAIEKRPAFIALKKSMMSLLLN